MMGLDVIVAASDWTGLDLTFYSNAFIQTSHCSLLLPRHAKLCLLILFESKKIIQALATD